MNNPLWARCGFLERFEDALNLEYTGGYLEPPWRQGKVSKGLIFVDCVA
jgi:hypothetical protein